MSLLDGLFDTITEGWDDTFLLPDFEYYSQRDNSIAPNISCFPTSMAMAMNHCLSLEGLDKEAIGCAADMQIEDYINESIESTEVKNWMKRNFRRSWWGWKYRNKRTIFSVEIKVFNLLMNPIGFTASYTGELTYDMYCAHMYYTSLPIVLSGNFKSVSRVGGHIVCGIGYNKKGLGEVIVHDPFGNALNGYPRGQSIARNNAAGTARQYGTRFFIRNNKGHMRAVMIERVE